ncbi:hypothetical protein GVAV_000655 [Gurleya vavrai]
MTQEYQILPFYIKPHKNASYKNYCDLNKDEEILRGLKCKKTLLDKKIKVYKDGIIVNDPIYIWKQIGQNEDSFSIGLEIIENKIQKDLKISKSLFKFLKTTKK